MLISETVTMKWNPKIKKHYVDLGYRFTKMSDEFQVNIDDLTSGSNVLVTVKCDYCNRIYQTPWYTYYQSKNKLIKKDCCNNPDCTGKKSKETLQKKYDVSNFREIPGINEKIAATNLGRYGAENPFGSKYIQEKIIETNQRKYGVDWYTQTDECKERYRQTCMEKYGVPNYSYTTQFIELMSGENSPLWKGDDLKIPRDRHRECAEYRYWRKSVFDRDRYTCQCCGARNGNGKYIELVGHHIEN